MRAATREAIETIALAVFLVLFLQATVQNYRVEGPSMDATLHNFDRVLVNKVVYMEIDPSRLNALLPLVEFEGESLYPFHPPERGDVIVFKYPRNPRENFVKRVIGLPGDTVRIERGVVYVNGEPLDEPYVAAEHASSETIPERTIGEGQYYVLGDNREHSDDSRHWGTVPKENIIGKVWVSYWPLDHFSTLLVRAVGATGVVVP